MNYYPKWTLVTILVLLLFVILLCAKSHLDLTFQLTIIGSSLLFFVLFWIILFHKNGFLIKNSYIHTATFYSKIPVLSKKLNLSIWTSISILKSTRRMGGEWLYNEELFRVTLLNKNHTIKSIAVTTKSELEAKSLIEFVIKNTNLKHEIYNPRF